MCVCVYIHTHVYSLFVDCISKWFKLMRDVVTSLDFLCTYICHCNGKSPFDGGLNSSDTFDAKFIKAAMKGCHLLEAIIFWTSILVICTLLVNSG